jgi:hypothetical protein
MGEVKTDWKIKLEMLEAKYRLDLNLDEIRLLREIIANAKVDDYNLKDFNSLIEKIENPKIIKRSQKKTEAAWRVAAGKEDKSIEKIENAINILKLYNKKITIYGVAKEAGISYNTAKKHIVNSNYFKSLVEMK